MALDNKLTRSIGRWLGVFAVVVVMLVFWESSLLWPLKIFVVLLHELSHIVAIVLTGGHPSSISLSMNQGGLATGTGGWRFVVLNAGYLGSLVWGLVLLAIANRRKAVPWSLRAMGIALGLATLVWMRPLISFGFVYGIVASAVLFAIGARTPAWVGAAFLRIVGLFSCLYALVDIQLDVLHPAASGHVSDASMLADLTGIPSAVWGVAWSVFALGILFLFRSTVVGRSEPSS